MGALLNSAILAAGARESLAFERAIRDPRRAQLALLRAILRDNRETAFGRAHEFRAIDGAAAYASRVPVREYEALRPYVDRLLRGEPNVLTGAPPFMFTTTSGTSGAPKFIPVTRPWADAMAGLMRLWTVHAVRDHPGMLARKVLTMVSPAVEGLTPCGLPFGAMTGLTYQRLPRLIRHRQAVPYAAALIADHETRYFVALRLALAESISSVGDAESEHAAAPRRGRWPAERVAHPRGPRRRARDRPHRGSAVRRPVGPRDPRGPPRGARARARSRGSARENR
jgi:hypothetical protein